MSEIAVSRVAITTVGSAGSAVGSGITIPINGFLLDVYLDYHWSAPATTDVTITDPVFGTVFTKSNNATDVWYAPRKQTVDQSGSDTGTYELIPLCGPLTISVAQADALTDLIAVTVRWMTP